MTFCGVHFSTAHLQKATTDQGKFQVQLGGPESYCGNLGSCFTEKSLLSTGEEAWRLKRPHGFLCSCRRAALLKILLASSSLPSWISVQKNNSYPTIKHSLSRLSGPCRSCFYKFLSFLRSSCNTGSQWLGTDTAYVMLLNKCHAVCTVLKFLVSGNCVWYPSKGKQLEYIIARLLFLLK